MIDTLRARIESLTGHQDFRFVSERSFAVMAVKAIGAALALLTQIVLARVLGVNEFGVYAYALSWAMIFVGLSRAGMDLAVVKYIPIHRADNEPEKIRGLIVTALCTLLVAFLICIVIGAVFIGYFVHPDLLVAARTPLLYASIFFVLLFSLGQILQAILRGIKHLVVPEIMDNIVRPLTLIFLVIVFHRFVVTATSSENAAGTAMAATAMAAGITCAIMGWSLKRDLRLEKDGTNFSMFRQWFGLALPMMMMVGVNDIIVRIDILMVGKMLGPALAGIYSVSAKLAELSLFGLNAANGVLSPLIAEYHHAGQKERLQKILSSSAWIIFFVTISITLILCIAGPFILPLFGKEFTAAYVPMLVLLAGQLVNALTGPLAAILVLSGHQMKAVKILICKAILNFSGNFLLIPLMGITGAAIAAAATITFTNLALFYYVYRLLGLNPSVFPLPARR